LQRDFERRKELEDAIRAAVDSRKAAESAPAKLTKARRNNKALLAVLLLTWASMAYLWIARPAWVFQPDAPQPLNSEQEQAALRFAMYLQRGRVEAYLREHGRLPASVADLDQREEGVELEFEGGQYLLVGRRAGHELLLNSRMNADSFLGNSIDVLRGVRAAAGTPRTASAQ